MSSTTKDSLGDRQKAYERVYAGQRLLGLIPAIARIDGKAFHTFTRGLARPYDERLSNLMVNTTKYLVEETGASMGYTQSDEISLVWYSDAIDTQIFFDAKVLKMTSILAAITSVYFNRRLAEMIPEKQDRTPVFDARVWSVPTRNEACLYLLWREEDATRNSISMAASSVYSEKELHQKGQKVKQEMLWRMGINWNNYPGFFKRGSYVQRRTTERTFSAEEIAKLPPKHEAIKNPEMKVARRDIVVLDMPPFKKVENRIHVVFDGAEPRLRGETDGR